jgi:hypothetical protein
VGDALQQTPRWLTALIVGAVTHGWAAVAVGASPAEPEPVEARLEIDTHAAGSGAEVLQRRIEERANIVLRQGKVLPGDAEDAAILVVVRELAGDDPGYAVSFELRASDGSKLAEPTEIECPLCTETELVARVEAELEPVIQTLRELEAARREPAIAPEPPAPTVGPQVETPVEAPPRSRKAMLAGGITLLVVGGGALGAGVGLAIPEPKIDEHDPLDLITTRPIGYALLAGGIVAATTGAVLTALAVKHRRRSEWSMIPYGGRHQAGLMIDWRFR